jgi:hypothetical protein
LLPAGETFGVPQKVAAAFAWLSGRCPLPFKTAEVIIWSAKKNTPRSGRLNDNIFSERYFGNYDNLPEPL